ncbi:MAG: Coenzyme PQQ synthesis protein E [Anaerolineae bacterium]|nr:Coenzyme PQQ synthesis protein E [Anaerolineae bacterium]
MVQADSLNKLYIEATTACNLDCQMCLRRTWDEPIGHMPLATFAKLMDDVAQLPAPPTIHLSGYGEPLAHPHFLEMVRLAKATGAKVEITTNGMLLTPKMAEALIELDLNRLMVSIDSVQPELYNNIRVRSDYKTVIDNLRHLRRLKLRGKGRHSNPQVGISFVAMRSNVADLPKLPALATYLGAWEIQVSNLVPHTPDMEGEILYSRSLRSAAYRASRWVPDMNLPKMDMDTDIRGPVSDLYDSTVSLSWLDQSMSRRNNYCRFAQEGYAAIRQDGEVSPCLPLLHDHPTYLLNRRKQITHLSLGNINQQSLGQIWESPEFTAHRQRLLDFPFSPCSTCGGCERFPGNWVDCSHNTFPTCGGCLWSQGFVQCP